ncbi:hypothetical protein GOV12_01275 [Candidatus Pacearchaeota archaeon]|nr:hypothetical protein [Candidatus Pacearchaeota archaeon]
MKIKYILILIIIVIVLIIINIMIYRGPEDSWIKDSKGVWIKHGVPKNTPDYVGSQKQVLACSFALYNKFKDNVVLIDSQCLGVCNDYSVDIVNVPRNFDDSKVENQCPEYREGITTNFIELDKDGEIVRIVEK